MSSSPRASSGGNGRRRRGELKTNVLFAAIKKQRDLKELLQQVDDRHINAQDFFKNSCLHHAIKVYEGDLSAIELLLKYKANTNVQNYKGETPLHFAVKNSNCNTDLIQLLLENDGDPNLQNYLGETPLHIVIKVTHYILDNDAELVKLLLNRGADPNISDSRGITPMRAAFGRNPVFKPFNWNIVLELIEHGGDMGLTLDTNTVLHLALHWTTDLSIIKKIIHHKPCLTKHGDRFRDTPLHLALHKKCPIDIIMELLNNGANANARNATLCNPLHYPVKCGYSTLATLIKNGADVNAVNNIGNTPLLEAVNCRMLKFNPTSVAVLLEFGADANVRCALGKTPIYYAKNKCNENFDIIKLLLEYGADPNQMNFRKHPVLDCSSDTLARFVIPFLVLRNFKKKKDLQNPEKVVNFKFYAYDQQRFQNYIAIRDTCMSELMKMKKDKIDKRHSLYKYVFDNCIKQQSSFDYPPLTIRKVLIREHKYPCSNDLILTSMKRSELLKFLPYLIVYMNSKENNGETESVILSYYAVCNIAKFLTKSGLIKLIKVYSNIKCKSLIQ